MFVLSQGELAPQGWKTPCETAPTPYTIPLTLNIFAILDIIALLVVGVFMVSLFLVWERYLEQVLDDPSRVSSVWTPPPLMRLSLWARAKGRMAVILAIVFLHWSAFISWNFWVQVCAVPVSLSAGTCHMKLNVLRYSCTIRNTCCYHLNRLWSGSCPCMLSLSCATFSLQQLLANCPWSSS